MNAGAPDSELARLIGAHPELIRAICAFNQAPADYIDTSQREALFSPLVHDVLWDSARSRRHLSRHIVDCLGGSSCLDAARPEWPVALLERPRLDRFARHLAAALVGERVRRTISRAEVLRWRDWLSPEAHEFALRRAGLLPVKADAPAGCVSASAEHLGLAWIVAATRRWHEAIAARFMLKLPQEPFEEAAALDDGLAWRLVSSVLSVVEPRWCSSFAITRA